MFLFGCACVCCFACFDCICWISLFAFNFGFLWLVVILLFAALVCTVVSASVLFWLGVYGFDLIAFALCVCFCLASCYFA